MQIDVKISDVFGVYKYVDENYLCLYDDENEGCVKLQLEDAAKLANVLLRYVVTGKIGDQK